MKKNKGLGIAVLILILAIVFLAVVLLTTNSGKKQEDKVLPYTDLIKQIASQNIAKVEMTTGSTTVKVTLKKEIDEKGNIVKDGIEYKEKKEEQSKSIKDLFVTQKSEEETQMEEKLVKTTIVPNTESFIGLIQDEVAKENDIELIQKTPSFLTKLPSYIFSLLPTFIMLALFIMIFKMQGLTEKGEVYDDTERKIKVKFEDVAGLNEEKGELIEIVDFLKNPKRYTQMGAKIPKGILLYGKPGTGKTLIAKAIAGEANVPFISMSGSEFIEMFAGLGASRVRKLFDRARKLEPCIVFIDEIDAIGSRRTNASGAESENNQTLNQLLVEMDGFSSEETIIVLAATNRPEMLDKALLRPGRFDRQIVVPTPDLRGREEILKIHAKDKKFAEDITFKSIAEDTAGFTGAELANILNEAAIIATKNEHQVIEQMDVEEAVKKVTVGLEKKNRVISDKEKKITAYHEAGHAVVSWYLPTQTEVKEISIVPRGMAGGYTMYKNDEDKSYISKTEMEEKLIALLGGRAAEQVALNEISTGASNDIEVATQIARDMVIKYGMNKTIGTISLKDENGDYQLEMFGLNMGDKIGKEIKQLLDTAYNDAQTILREHYDKLDAIAQRLLATEKINAEEFKKFFE
ncbi:MAG: ATP-dependent zinc metalloprotease FtsH [Clostridia bacterium]|nr:ATP-dependent zinc metalloprotease FtsH [Clostridia bacterium]